MPQIIIVLFPRSVAPSLLQPPLRALPPPLRFVLLVALLLGDRGGLSPPPPAAVVRLPLGDVVLRDPLRLDLLVLPVPVVDGRPRVVPLLRELGLLMGEMDVIYYY